jgi:hypothetical protein
VLSYGNAWRPGGIEVSQPEGNTRWEEIKVTGDQLVGTVKELVREGNIRRIVIKNDEGHVFLEIPLTVGVVGALLLPVLAAVGALAAVASGLTIAVERIVQPGEETTDGSDTPTPTPPAAPGDATGDDGPEG